MGKTQYRELYDYIARLASERRKGISELVTLFEMRADAELAYAKALRKIGESPLKVTSVGTLAHGVQALKRNCINKSDASQVFAKSIREDIKASLDELHKQQSLMEKRLVNQGRQLIKSLVEGSEELGRKYEKYAGLVSDLRKYEQAIEEIDVEIREAKKQQSNNGELIYRKKLLGKRLLEEYEELEESERVYIETTDRMNDRVAKYKGEMGALLEVFKHQESQRLEIAKDCLRKFLVYQTSQEMNSKYDVQSMSETMEGIDVEADTTLVWNIERVVMGLTRCEAFEVVEHQVNIADFCADHEIDPPAEKKALTSKKVGKGLDHLSNQQMYERLFTDLETIIDSAWAGQAVEPQDETLFRNIVKEQDARRLFTTALHKHFPEKGALNQLELNAFESIVRLLRVLLTESEADRDFESSRYILDFSQHFYCVDQNGRSHLLDALRTHPVWHSAKFWDKYASIEIQEQLQEEEKLLRQLRSVTPEEKEAQEKEAVKRRLKSVTLCMISVNLHKDKAEAVLDKHAHLRKLSQKCYGELIGLLERKKDGGAEEEVKRSDKWLNEVIASDPANLGPAMSSRLSLSNIFDGVKARKAENVKQAEGESPSPIQIVDDDDKEEKSPLPQEKQSTGESESPVAVAPLQASEANIEAQINASP